MEHTLDSLRGQSLIYCRRGCCGRDRTVVRFTSTCAYHHWSCELETCSWRGVLNTTLCDKVCQWLATGWWFSPITPISSTNKTDRHDIAEILLKVSLSTIRPKKNMCVYGHPTHPIFQPPTLTFFICNYSTLIFANDPINFYTEFGWPFLLFNQQQCFIYSTASFLSKLRAKKVKKLCNSS
jgi:hypothetical protein